MQKAVLLPSTPETELKKFILKTSECATRKNLIQVLQAVQEKYGYLSKESLKMIANNLSASFSEVYGVATFYHQFRLQPPGKYIIQVCMGTGCHARGNADNFEHLKLLLDLRNGQNLTKDKVFTLEAARCFGCCSLSPVIMITDSTGNYRKLYGHVDQKALKKILTGYREKSEQQDGEPEREALICRKN